MLVKSEASKDAKAILKFIFPLLGPNKKMPNYNTELKAMSRLFWKIVRCNHNILEMNHK